MKGNLLFLLVIFIFSLMPASIVAAVEMPSFSLSDVVSGKQVDSSSFKGKALLVTFFATWCPPCRMEVPELKKLQESFGDKKFSVVAISVDQGGVAGVADFVARKELNYPVLMASYKTISDFGGVYGIPTSFLVNTAGSVVKRYQGFVDYDTLERDITRAMQ